MWWPRQNAPVAESPWKTSQTSARGYGFASHKARKAGVPVLHVNPAYTSRTCAQCGHIDKANRASQARFACRSCSVVAHAHWNGSCNIRHRAEALWRRGCSQPAQTRPPSTGRGAGRNRSTTADGARCAGPGLFSPVR
ncbi:zinc ribbon domain-containing protein [Streptomyces sp. NPDC058320]|uniref:zinc ribbon domain-containing protein n=1 Tax=unclassified Streptomyces TaxID=2593676 RepID=UPI0036272D0D